MTISDKAREELDQIIADTVEAYYASEENRKVLQDDLYPDLRDEIFSEVEPELAGCNTLIEANQEFLTRIDEELLKLTTKYHNLRNMFKTFVMIVVVCMLVVCVVTVR